MLVAGELGLTIACFVIAITMIWYGRRNSYKLSQNGFVFVTYPVLIRSRNTPSDRLTSERPSDRRSLTATLTPLGASYSPVPESVTMAVYANRRAFERHSSRLPLGL